MNVAFLIQNLRTKGGGPRQLLELAVAMKRRGHTVTIAAYYYDRLNTYTELCDQLDVRSVERPLPDTQPPATGRSPLRMIKDFISFVRREYVEKPHQLAGLLTERPDAINIHEWPANWAARYLKRRWPTTPIVWTCNDIWHFDPEEYDQTKPASLLGRFMKAVAGMPMRRLDAWATRSIDRIIVLADYLIPVLERHYHRPTMTVRCGMNVAHLKSLVDPHARQTVLQRHRLQPRDTILLCASIFYPHRRFEDAIEALSRMKSTHPNTKLFIVGSTGTHPAYADKIKNLIHERQLDSDVILVSSFLTDDELFRYYQACDIFVFPNNHQTWGLAPIEAMFFGKPVIVTPGAGVHEVIRDGENGVIARQGDPDDLTKKIIRLIDQPKARKNVADAGQRFAATFSWDAQARRMEAVLGTGGNRR